MLVVDASAVTNSSSGAPRATVVASTSPAMTSPCTHRTSSTSRSSVRCGGSSPPARRPAERAGEAIDDLLDLPIERYPHLILVPRIWELRENFSAYDAGLRRAGRGPGRRARAAAHGRARTWPVLSLSIATCPCSSPADVRALRASIRLRWPLRARRSRPRSRRSPPTASSARRTTTSIEHAVRGSSITILERRPPWNPAYGSEWSSLKVAQLRYDDRARRWRLYSSRQQRPLASVRARPAGGRGRAAARRDRGGPHRHLLGLSGSQGASTVCSAPTYEQVWIFSRTPMDRADAARAFAGRLAEGRPPVLRIRRA